MTRTLFDRTLPGGGRMVPTGPVRVNVGHPLAQGLSDLFIPAISLRGLVSGTLLTAQGAPTISGSSQGPSLLFSGAQALAAGSFFSPVPLNVSVFGLLNVTTLAFVNNGALIGGGGGPGGSPYINGSFEFGINKTSGVLFLNKQNQIALGTSTSAVTAGAVSSIGCTYSSAGAFHFYINGQDAGGSGSNLQTFAANGTEFGFANSNPNDSLTGGILAIFPYNRVLSSAEAAALAAAPFSMLESAEPMGAFWWVGGGGPTSLTFALASLRMGALPLGTNAETALSITRTPLRMTPAPLNANAETALSIALAPLRMGALPLGTNAETQLSIAERTLAMAPLPLGTNAETAVPITTTTLQMAARPLTVVASVAVTIARVALRMAAYPFAGFGKTSAGGVVRGVMSAIVNGIVRR